MVGDERSRGQNPHSGRDNVYEVKQVHGAGSDELTDDTTPLPRITNAGASSLSRSRPSTPTTARNAHHAVSHAPGKRRADPELAASRTAAASTPDHEEENNERDKGNVRDHESPEHDQLETRTGSHSHAHSHTHSHGHSHGHSHSHGPAEPASRRVRLLLIWLLAPIAALTIVGVLVLYPWSTPVPTSAIPQGKPVNANITATSTGPCLAKGQVQVQDQPAPDDKPCLTTDLRLSEGAHSGQRLSLIVPIEPSSPRFAAGDQVVLSYNGGDPADPSSYQLVDFQRGFPMVLLAILFAIAVIVLGRWQGFAALVALALSFLVIALFVLPAILTGENPLMVAICGAGVIMFIALYLTHGLSARTSVAVLGTLASLALIGILSAIFSAAASLTGLDDSTSTLIGSLGHGIDARGLLLAGVVIGALGVLDDVTITQTSAVWELRKANPALTWRELNAAGLRIGRDHVGSAVNTLVMAYAGAALPVLLISSISGVGLGSILSSQDIAEEIIRTLAGSVGIVAAVPLTTVLAALIASQEPDPLKPEVSVRTSKRLT